MTTVWKSFGYTPPTYRRGETKHEASRSFGIEEFRDLPHILQGPGGRCLSHRVGTRRLVGPGRRPEAGSSLISIGWVWSWTAPMITNIDLKGGEHHRPLGGVRLHASGLVLSWVWTTSS